MSISTSPNLHFVADRDGAMILDIKANAMITLNPTGAFIWEKLQRNCPVEEIISALVIDSGLTTQEITQDVSTFIDTLSERGLVHVEL